MFVLICTNSEITADDVAKPKQAISADHSSSWWPRAGSEVVRIDPLGLLIGCRNSFIHSFINTHKAAEKTLYIQYTHNKKSKVHKNTTQKHKT